MIKTCKNCKKEFNHTGNSRGVFCTHKCYIEYRKTEQSEYRKVEYIKLTCTSCGKEFERREAEATRPGLKFCSRRCSGNVSGGKASRMKSHTSITKQCSWCGTDFKVKHSRPNAKFCCRACNDLARAQMFGGKNNPNYRHGKNQTSAIYTAQKHYEQKCILCGFDIAVHAHHITPKSEGGTNEPENIAILCPNHHAMAHKGLIAKQNLLDASQKAFIPNTQKPSPVSD